MFLGEKQYDAFTSSNVERHNLNSMTTAKDDLMEGINEELIYGSVSASNNLAQMREERNTFDAAKEPSVLSEKSSAGQQESMVDTTGETAGNEGASSMRALSNSITVVANDSSVDDGSDDSCGESHQSIINKEDHPNNLGDTIKASINNKAEDNLKSSVLPDDSPIISKSFMGEKAGSGSTNCSATGGGSGSSSSDETLTGEVLVVEGESCSLHLMHQQQQSEKLDEDSDKLMISSYHDKDEEQEQLGNNKENTPPVTLESHKQKDKQQLIGAPLELSHLFNNHEDEAINCKTATIATIENILSNGGDPEPAMITNDHFIQILASETILPEDYFAGDDEVEEHQAESFLIHNNSDAVVVQAESAAAAAQEIFPKLVENTASSLVKEHFVVSLPPHVSIPHKGVATVDLGDLTGRRLFYRNCSANKHILHF